MTAIPSIKTELSGFEKLWYYVLNVLSVGLLFTLKVVIKKAIIESER